MSIVCGTCRSDNVQRLALIYEGGISELNGKESGVGVGIGTGGLGVGLGSSKITGSNQSALSKRAAPPPKKRPLKLALYYGIGFFIALPLAVNVLSAGDGLARFLSLAYFVGAGVHVYANIQYNRKVYPKLFREWGATFMCLKCGGLTRKEYADVSLASAKVA